MNKINKILACVDLSDYSVMTLEYALELARLSQAKILVLNVINQKDISAVETVAKIYPLDQTVQSYVKDLSSSRFQGLREMIRKHFPEEEPNLELKVDIGIPYESILKTADREEVDLIVMANKGRSNLSRVFFGSAAEKVFRHAKVPVISVRDRHRFKRGQ